MYRKISDFLAEWKYEAASTEKLLSHLTDAALQKKFDDNVRSISILTWHVVVSINEMLSHAGITGIEGPKTDAPPPKTVKEVVDAYHAASHSVFKVIPEQWKDNALEDKVNMYGEQWSKGQVLSVLIRHQTHHRGQLTVLMRLAGLKIVGIYGPTKEEWANMNMPAME